MIDFKPPPLFAKAGGFDGNVDRWQHATWRPPSIVYMDVGAAKTGTGAPEGDRSQGISIWSTHLVTPETDTICHYHFGFARNFQRDDAAMSKLLYDGTVNTFLEDKAMLEAQQKNVKGGALDGMVHIGADAAQLQARRMLEELCRAEARKLMPRIPVPTPETMSPEQRRVHDSIVGLRGGHMPAPYRTALHSPELCDKWQQMGELLRYRTSLPARLSELAVLVVARHHGCHYVWHAHAPVAMKAGVTAEAVEAIRAGQRPAVPRGRRGCGSRLRQGTAGDELRQRSCLQRRASRPGGAGSSSS